MFKKSATKKLRVDLSPNVMNTPVKSDQIPVEDNDRFTRWIVNQPTSSTSLDITYHKDTDKWNFEVDFFDDVSGDWDAREIRFDEALDEGYQIPKGGLLDSRLRTVLFYDYPHLRQVRHQPSGK